MASRTLTVALRALVQGYTGPMRTAAAATGPLEASLMRVQRAGDGMSRVGSSLTRSLTVPLVAVGAIATKMAADFDKSFTTMQTLAGVTGDEVEGLKDKVLDLAGETGRAPQELAEALYFLQSSGLDSAQALDALEVSAKGSAAGLGDTAVIADAVSSAMLGYAQSGLTAAAATDVLVATARAGKAEPAELASQMGRLVPVASELGISFDQVGGAIAALSTKGFNAEQATTALTNVMAKLLKPSQMAEQALEGVGLSTDGIRQMIAERGLLGTLEELKARLGDSGFVRFLEDQQAVQGGLALLGGDLDATKAIMDEVADSAGATENAFGTWADSMGAKNSQAFAKFQVAMIKLGDAIAPVAADIAQFVAGIAEAFSDLPGPVQKAIVVVGLLVAVLGPMMLIGGKVASTFATVGRALSGFAAPAGTVSGAFNTMGANANSATGGMSQFAKAAGVAGAAGAVIGLVVALKAMDDARSAQQAHDNAEAFVAMGDAAEAASGRILERWRQIGDLGEGLVRDTFNALRDSNVEAAERFIDSAEAAGFQAQLIDDLRESLEQKRDADVQGAVDQEVYAAAIDDGTDAIQTQEEAYQGAIDALKEYGDTLRAQFDPLFGLMDALHGNQEAQQAVTDAQNAYNEALAGGDPVAVAEAQAALTEAQRQAAGSALDVTGATAEMNAAVAENPGLLASSKAQLMTWVAQGLISAETAAAMAAQFDTTAGRAVALGKTDPNVTVSATDNASGTFRTIAQRLLDLDGDSATVTIRANYTYSGYSNIPGAAAALRGTGATGGIVPQYLALGGMSAGPKGTDTVPAWLTPGEMVLNRQQQANLFNLLASGPMTSAASMGGGTGGGRVDVGFHITGSGGGWFSRLLHEEVRAGRVQMNVNGQRVRVSR